LAHLTFAALLTVLTQLGGAAWLLSRLFRRKLLAFGVLYITFSLSIIAVAPSFGRTALPCVADAPAKMHSPLYCIMNRHYVTPDVKAALHDVAIQMEQSFPDTRLRILDANFPLFDGFPLLPHLSHDDGRKVDLALLYKDAQGNATDQTPSPLGYFAFEQGPTQCPKRWATLRWDIAWLQPLWKDLSLDADRTRALVTHLIQLETIDKVFLEPHLQEKLGLSFGPLRFQGCRAARHDDHIHLQLKM